MVLDQKQVPTTHVTKRQVIDGQQRLTTFQVFLAAFRDFSRAHGCEAVADECGKFTANTGMMPNPEVDCFKVWPTQRDRLQYKDVLTAGSRERLEQLHPLHRRKYARRPDPRAPMVEAYLYFYKQLTEFFVGSETDPPLMGQVELAARLDECLQALRHALQVVVIDLEPDDDAQVIFETLNGRGEPLLPADLLRNDIFLRAARQGESQEQLYERHWSRFEDAFWRTQIKQGRLLRPRSDLFLQHYLASRRSTDIPIKHLFVEYKHWIKSETPFSSVDQELATLARQGEDFRRIVSPVKGDPIYGLANFLEAFDVRTSYPLLLALLDVGMADQELSEVGRIIESYLLRRAVCGLPTKNYNRIFLQLTRNIRREGASAAVLKQQLLALTGESGEWPSDSMFKERWRTGDAYHTLGSAKLGHILKRISDRMISAKMEDITVESPLTVEHIMPQSWQQHWPFASGEHGLVDEQLEKVADDDPRLQPTLIRNAAVQTMGNLTIITQRLNSSNSNVAWAEKRQDLLMHALLPINRDLQKYDAWDESSITTRGEALLEHALKIWLRN